MQPFDDIFLAPPDGSMFNNERGLFIPLDMNAINMIKDELFHIVIQRDPMYDVITFPPPIAVYFDGAIRRMGSIAISVPIFEKFLSENPDLWIMHTSRNMSDGVYYATTELNSHLPLRIAEDNRRKARGCMYKIMVHWTLDMLHTLAHRAGIAMPPCVRMAHTINTLRTSSGDSTYFMTDITVWLADNDGQGKFTSIEAADAGYKLTRSMFTLMRARLIVFMRRFTQPDTARKIVCMAYPRRSMSTN